MRRFVFLLLLSALLTSVAFADERILAWHSEIRINPDSTMDVVETLRVRAEGRQIRRGIYREFPTVYTDRRGQRVVTGFELVEVQRDGRAEPHHQEKRSNGVRVYVGDQDVYLPAGEYTYRLTYRTDRQLGFFPDHDELYWNVTGNGWDFPIDAVTAEVILPAAVPRDSIELEAYTGPMGATGRDWTAGIVQGVAVYRSTRVLDSREGLTIVATWPTGFVTPPDSLQNAGYMLRDAWPAALALGGLVLLLLYYLRAWTRVGRDPASRAVVPRYEPPEGQSPASMRYLMQMAYDDRCFAAAVLSLAVKGYLSIEQSSSGFFGRSSEFALTRRYPPPAEPLSRDETSLLEKLFAGEPRLELDNENHAVINAAKESHEAALKQKFRPRLFRVNGGWHALGIVMSLLLAALAIGWPLARGGFSLPWFFSTRGGWLTLAVVVTGILANAVFGRLLKAPTVAGREVMDHIEGFRLFLDVAEGDELELAGAPSLTPRLFEQNLPAALALEVEQHWAERFADVFSVEDPSQAPGWYQGDRWDTSDLGRFSSSFGSSFDSAISSASRAPGSSSGSGGGGSSGGGGGGGGGGGW